MDPITLIISALVAGATAGLKDTASNVVKDAYNSLKKLIIKDTDNTKQAESAIQVLEANPLEKNQQLEMVLRDKRDNAEILNLSIRLLELINSDKSQTGKPTITINNSQGINLGNNNSITQNFNLPKDEE
jgi:hypothetical protein